MIRSPGVNPSIMRKAGRAGLLSGKKGEREVFPHSRKNPVSRIDLTMAGR